MKISGLYGKSVTDGDGTRLGDVIRVEYADGRITGLVLADDDQREVYADAEHLKMGRKLVCLKARKPPKGGRELRLGRPAYDDEGIFLGCLEEVRATGDRLISAKIGLKTYDFADVTLGDAVIVRKKAKTDGAKDMLIDALLGTDRKGANG